MNEPKIYLGIEGGGTRTTAMGLDEGLNPAGKAEFGPGNTRLLQDEELRNLFREIAGVFSGVRSIGMGMAGVRSGEDRERIRAIAGTVWPGVPCVVTHDLEVALRAAPEHEAGVLVLSGTGSCCYGRRADGREAKVGGWGHLLGDVGSGYDIAFRAIRSAVHEYDRFGRWSAFGARALRFLQFNDPEELIGWIQAATKTEVARLAPEVFEAAREKDPGARRILSEAAEALAADAVRCGERLAGKRGLVRFFLAGSVLRQQPMFAKQVGKLIRAERPNARVELLEGEGAFGAAKMAVGDTEDTKGTEKTENRGDRGRGKALETAQRKRPAKGGSAGNYYVPDLIPAQSPTEQRNPKSRDMDRLSVAGMVELMLEAEGEVVPALRKEQRRIIQAASIAAEALGKGGRILYVGAGTSGRLGVLDASECPPTFRASPELVQGIIAGGQRALWQAVEGAEDDAAAGAASLAGRQVDSRDAVIGIAASGRTPFVWGAMAEARKRGAATILICFNPSLRIAREHRPDVVIAPNLGPEILTGSTRLKSGTATKLILNMISTISMVKLGKVVSNLMIDLNPSNVKLRDRAVRIIQELAGCDRQAAFDALERNGWVVKSAWQELSGRK